MGASGVGAPATGAAGGVAAVERAREAEAEAVRVRAEEAFLPEGVVREAVAGEHLEVAAAAAAMAGCLVGAGPRAVGVEASGAPVVAALEAVARLMADLEKVAAVAAWARAGVEEAHRMAAHPRLNRSEPPSSACLRRSRLRPSLSCGGVWQRMPHRRGYRRPPPRQ